MLARRGAASVGGYPTLCPSAVLALIKRAITTALGTQRSDSLRKPQSSFLSPPPSENDTKIYNPQHIVIFHDGCIARRFIAKLTEIQQNVGQLLAQLEVVQAAIR
jgi:hypothetical protein